MKLVLPLVCRGSPNSHSGRVVIIIVTGRGQATRLRCHPRLQVCAVVAIEYGSPKCPIALFTASTASSFVPNRLATWRPLNILRPSRPPILLPTSNITSATNNNTTTYHETKPVHIHTHVNAPSARREKRREKKNSGRCWLIILIIVLLYLVGNNIFLNIRVQSLTPSNSPNSGSSGVSDPPQAVKDCLSQFKLNAPSDPSSYPCGTCAPILQTIPNDLSPTAKKTDTAGQGTVLQFCALSDIVSATTNETLQNVGWMKNVDFCGSWSGIQCDTAGRVTVLTLVFPGVPATLAPSLSSLVGLQALSITGDGNIPAGPVAPSSANASSIFSLSALHNITLQSTALTGPLPDATFANSHNLTSVQLVNNAHLGQTLPSSLFTLPSLNALVVNGQSLTQSLTSAFSSASSGLKSSLTTLDLSSNSLPGSVPDFSEFTALVELSLGANQFTSLPSSDSGLPASLKTLNMAKNPDLSGNVPNVVCADSALTACDLRNTQLGINGQNATTGMCGHCLFGSA